MITSSQVEDFGTEYKWKMSNLATFGSNIGLIMYSCSEGAGETKDQENCKLCYHHHNFREKSDVGAQ